MSGEDNTVSTAEPSDEALIGAVRRGSAEYG